jgi:glucosamine--fructose-6-phosphate aminotransferase (isomerizing)
MQQEIDPRQFEHWMLREIHEQPQALTATLEEYVANGVFKSDIKEPMQAWLTQANGNIVIAASGSSRHAGMAAEIMLEDLSGIAVDVEYASEYCYRLERATKKAAVVVISQSGETADTLAALRKANEAGHPTLAITNAASSTMAKEATVSFPTLAGRERAIPATKSFTAQLLNLQLLALLAADSDDLIPVGDLTAILAELTSLPSLIASQLDSWQGAVEAIADQYRDKKNFLFLGRDIHYPIAREGALKLKESAYLHAEGYPSGELKHGPNALVSEDTPLVIVATVDHTSEASVLRYQKTIQLMRDMRQQGADILALVNAGDLEAASIANHAIFVRETRESLLTICEVIPLQLLSYFMAIGNGISVDTPRNLTKAVLTE